MHTPREHVEIGFDFFGHHVRVQQASHGPPGRVTGDEEGTARSGRVFFEHGAQPSGNRLHHFSGHGKKTRVAEISRIILGLVSAGNRDHRGDDLPGSHSETWGRNGD